MIKKLPLFVLIAIFLVSGCALKPGVDTGDSASRTLTVEEQLAEANRKIEELQHTVSVIQFMVDNHQRIITGKETPGSRKGSEREDSALDSRNSGRNYQNSGRSNKALFPAQKNRGSNDFTSVYGMKMKKKRQEREAATKTTQEAMLDDNSPESKYKRAFSLYKAGNYKVAQEMFVNLSTNFPGHELADNSLYWGGECDYAIKDYLGAIFTFKKVVDAYPKGDKYEDALLKIGFSYLALNDKRNAEFYLKRVVEERPFSAAAPKAQEKLRLIR